MPSDVDICNLALSHIGDDATVSSINPPEGSAQAEHCARFYPIARDGLLEMHDWGFTTKRIAPAALTLDSVVTQWQHAYVLPSTAIKVISVLPPGSTDDYSAPPPLPISTLPDGSLTSLVPLPGMYQPQPFAVEATENNTKVVYTNQADAVIRYIDRVTDSTKFSPLFVTTLSWQLAAYLAGPIIKGSEGAAEGKRCMQMAQYWLGKAAVSDANQSRPQAQHNVPWMMGR